ncbi:flagellar basal body P-ring formation chaperone FlgA [Mesoaciditoga lauensis]|uniref:flagellar basal body P-ring formation chaperone FlgA n=1 Tax=Mesoaciditoga lauensis TaxID=1495039 RepID=UPI00055D46DB|nr:flagellar basal body P-ring formation chaperone FlgA [Mesoaciditoga lauensis]
MRNIAFVLLMIFATLTFSSTLTLKSSATVTGQYVTLYDLAATFDGVSAKRLKKFIVAFAPQPGRSYVLNADSIKIRAQNEIEWLKVFENSKNIKITSKAFVVDLSLIHDAIEEKVGKTVFLTNFPSISLSGTDYTAKVQSISNISNKYFALVRLNQNGSDSYVNVEFETTEIGSCDTLQDIKNVVLSTMEKGLSLSLASTTPGGKFDYVEVGKPLKSFSNILKVPVNLVSKSKKFSTVLEYKLSLYKNVVLAKKDIPYGKKISEDDLFTKRMNVYATSTIYATSVESCVGKISTWSFRKGQVISLNGLKSPPDVLTGEILIAYVSYPSMTITTFVRAMQNGNIGQIIAVRNVSNGYMLYGVVEKGPKIRIYSGGE